MYGVDLPSFSPRQLGAALDELQAAIEAPLGGDGPERDDALLAAHPAHAGAAVPWDLVCLTAIVVLVLLVLPFLALLVPV